MTPYWTSADGNLTIYHGDARDVLSTLDLSTVDLVLTDPPYGISGGKGTVSIKRGKGAYRTTLWNDDAQGIADVIAPIVVRCLDAVGRGAITPGITNLMAYPQPVDMGAFWSAAPTGRGPWGFNGITPILYYGKYPWAGKGNWPNSREVTASRSHCDWHPCPKPLDAWQWLLCKGSLEGETVLDPFAGAFTTLLAAQRTGRKAIGIEIEEYYCERGAERLSQTAFELPPTEPAPEQKEMEWAGRSNSRPWPMWTPKG